MIGSIWFWLACVDVPELGLPARMEVAERVIIDEDSTE